ncbi:MAG: ATP-binding protein [Bacteroidota bacterium]
MDTIRDALGLNYTLLNQAFPFHLILDQDLRIMGCGSSLSELAPASMPDRLLTDFFELTRPRITPNHSNLKRLSGNAVTLCFSALDLAFKFQLLADPDTDLLFLLGSPVLKDKSDFKQHGLRLRHFASHDAMPDYLMVLKPKEIDIAEKSQLMQKLNEQKAALQRAHDTLEDKVTERTKDLLEAKEMAEAGSLAKSEFLAMMSHEIRTPMNGVVGMTQILRSSPLSDDQRDCVDMIESCGEVLLSIINDILDFSKIEAGQLKLESRRFDLVKCIEEVLDILALSAYQKHIELAYALDPVCPTEIIGDSTRLRQILVNLLSNAVKFTQKGQITVEVSAEIKGLHNTLFHFRVTDSGIGIPPAKLDGLFDAFTQTDASITRKYGGTGLGLTICKRLCEMMGGHIWVESELGHGSIFHFQIEVPAFYTTLPTSAASASLPVLLYDENPEHGRLLAQRLKHFHIEATRMNSAEDLKHAMLANVNARCIINAPSLLLEESLSQVMPDPKNCIHLRSTHENRGAAALSAYMQLNKPVSSRQLAEVAAHLGAGKLPDPAIRNSFFAARYPLQLGLISQNRLTSAIFGKSLQKLGYSPINMPSLAARYPEHPEGLPFSCLLIDCDVLSASEWETLKHLRTSSASLKQTTVIALVPKNEPPGPAANPDLFDTYIEQPASLEIMADILRKTHALQSAFQA